MKNLNLLLKKIKKCVFLHISREKTKKNEKKFKKTPYILFFIQFLYIFVNNLEFYTSIY